MRFPVLRVTATSVVETDRGVRPMTQRTCQNTRSGDAGEETPSWRVRSSSEGLLHRQAAVRMRVRTYTPAGMGKCTSAVRTVGVSRTTPMSRQVATCRTGDDIQSR